MTLPVRFLLLFLTSCLTLAGLVHAQDSARKIVVSHAWVRAMPPFMANTAAYMTITNKTGGELILESASTSAAQTVELHRMVQVGDVMKMQQIDKLPIPSGGDLVLKPHGLHLMLIHLHNPLKEGETVRLVLHFAGGRNIAVNAVVRKWGKGH